MLMGSNILAERVERLFGMEGDCVANCAAAVLYNKHALEVTGAFDGDFWSDWEDHDLGFRLSVAGFRNVYTTKTYVLHVGGGSFGSGFSKDRYVRITRNMLMTYFKNYETPNLLTRFLFLFWVILPIRHLMSIIVYELKRLSVKSPSGSTLLSRQAYLSLPEAYIQFIRSLPLAIRKRLMVQAHRKVPDSLIFSVTERNWII
jgi:GT2 family glycosyltransferase